ncbi:MAG TPA: hypothetical protein VII62_06830 [Vicinamibacteria bacterium]
MKPATWRQVLSSFGSPARPRIGPDGEWLWLGRQDSQLVFVRAPQSCSFVVLSPKPQPWKDWLWDATPAGVGIVAGSCPTDASLLKLVPALSPKRSTAVFVGDMDSFGLVQLVEARRVLREANGPRLVYGGIDDVWLAAMERTLKRGRRLDSISIPLMKHERTLLKRLDRALDLERIVGPRSAALLRSGFKIELEGATNPHLYSDRHGRWIFEHLAARAEKSNAGARNARRGK